MATKKEAVVVEKPLEEKTLAEKTKVVTATPISAPIEPTYDGSGNQVHEISPIIKMAIEQAAARLAHDKAHGIA